MKHAIFAISTLGLCSALGAAAEPVTPQSDNDKVIYSLGYELGKDIKNHALELNPETLLQGVRDAIEGNKALVKTSSRAKALKQIKEQRAQDNLQQSQAYLAENAKADGVVTQESGLQYKVIKAGEGKTPQAKDSVVVHYRGTLIDGTQFDSSHDRGKPATFQVKRVIKGWAEALQLMQEGAKWELFIPPELAYGKPGRQKVIPPNSALIFEVELISVK